MSPNRFRLIALSLPGVIEGSHQGNADFRAGKRIFATLGYPDRDWGMVKLTPDQQSVLVEAEPETFRPVPGGWGKQGNTNVRLQSRPDDAQERPHPGVGQRRAEAAVRGAIAPMTGVIRRPQPSGVRPAGFAASSAATSSSSPASRSGNRRSRA